VTKIGVAYKIFYKFHYNRSIYKGENFFHIGYGQNCHQISQFSS